MAEFLFVGFHWQMPGVRPDGAGRRGTLCVRRILVWRLPVRPLDSCQAGGEKEVAEPYTEDFSRVDDFDSSDAGHFPDYLAHTPREQSQFGGPLSARYLYHRG